MSHTFYPYKSQLYFFLSPVMAKQLPSISETHMLLPPRLKIHNGGEKSHGGPSLVAQWLCLCSLNVGVWVWPPAPQLKIPHATVKMKILNAARKTQCSQINVLKNPTENGLTSPPDWLQLWFSGASLSKIRFQMADMSVLIISSKGVTPTFKSIFYKVNPGLKLQFLQQLQEKGGCGKTVHD